MRGNENSNTAENTPASRTLRPKKCLEPIFGASCRTQSFAPNDHIPATHFVYFEIWLDDPLKKTWTLSKIVHSNPAADAPENESVYTSVIKSTRTFLEALKDIAAIEQDWRKNSNQVTPLPPEPSQMGFSHFRAFAEREGYIFDYQGCPHARPLQDVLPPLAIFDLRDIETADKNLQRPENEFNNNGPASKIPQTHFLFDNFTRATHKNSLEESLNQLRVMDIMDTFTRFIETAHEKMTGYCENYHMLGYGQLMAEADSALASAESTMKQLKAYGLDIKELESFVLQCQITCHILHAQGLYDLMSNGKGDFEQNEAQFKEHVTHAITAFKKIDGSEQGQRMLENMIVQAVRPEVPAAIGLYLENYKSRRESFIKKPMPPSAPPAPPASKGP